MRNSAAIGACWFSGNDSVAVSTQTSSASTSVRIDSALMPGSNTPKPPGSQIHCCPGCQWCTSSFQTMRAPVSGRVRAHSRAASTLAAKRECHD